MAKLPRADSAAVGYFDRQSLGWTRRYGHDGYFRERFETVMGWMEDAAAGLRLLDYGCGSGVLLAALGRAGHQVTGVDLSAGMLAAARRAVESAGVPAPLFTLSAWGKIAKASTWVRHMMQSSFLE